MRTGDEFFMAEQTIPYKIYLDETELPRAWYNMRADMKVKPAPLLNPGTGKPLNRQAPDRAGDERNLL